MPKEKTVTTYLCEICGGEHQNKDNAIVCENRGIAVPEFKRYEVVELVGLSSVVVVSSGLKLPIQPGTKAVVHDDGGDEETKIDPHLLPTFYEVWVKTPNGSHKSQIAVVRRENMKKTFLNDGSIFCPLCGHRTQSIKSVASPYLSIVSGGLPPLKDMPMERCINCNVEFFTSQQSERADLFIFNNTKWKLADTKLLVKEHQFRF
jgi:DNA-directed RNA polymerase subunit RPC12/RpoP